MESQQVPSSELCGITAAAMKVAYVELLPPADLLDPEALGRLTEKRILLQNHWILEPSLEWRCTLVK